MILWIIDSKYHVRESTWYTTYPIWSFITWFHYRGQLRLKMRINQHNDQRWSTTCKCFEIKWIGRIYGHRCHRASRHTYCGYVTVTKTSSFFIHAIHNEFRKFGKLHENSVDTCTIFIVLNTCSIFIVLIHVRSSLCCYMYDLHSVDRRTMFIVLIHLRSSKVASQGWLSKS